MHPCYSGDSLTLLNQHFTSVSLLEHNWIFEPTMLFKVFSFLFLVLSTGGAGLGLVPGGGAEVAGPIPPM